MQTDDNFSLSSSLQVELTAKPNKHTAVIYVMNSDIRAPQIHTGSSFIFMASEKTDFVGQHYCLAASSSSIDSDKIKTKVKHLSDQIPDLSCELAYS